MSESYPKASFFFRWYDLWIGAYWDRRDRRLFICPVPMVGVVFDFGPRVPPPPKSFVIGVDDPKSFSRGGKI